MIKIPDFQKVVFGITFTVGFEFHLNAR